MWLLKIDVGDNRKQPIVLMMALQDLDNVQQKL